MKILHTVESYLPARHGMSEVVRQVSERLVALGHEVTVGTRSDPHRPPDAEIEGVRVVSFDISGSMVAGIKGPAREYENFLLESKFDIMANFAAQQWATDLALPLLGRIGGAKVFVPTGFSGLYKQEFAEYFSRMPEWMNQYDMNVFLSDTYRDVVFAREHGVGKSVLIPNGADEREFLAPPTVPIRRLLGIPENSLLILLVGSHTGLKGHAEAIEIFRNAALKGATLLIVANGEEGGCVASCTRSAALHRWRPRRLLDNKRLIVRSLAREETVAAYAAADIFLFPSRVECSPIVLFEAMASKTPFLTTDVGNAREIIDWSNGGELLPTRIDPDGLAQPKTDESSRMLERLAHDDRRRVQMGENGFAAWKERFTWDGIARQYERLYRTLSREAA